MDNADILALYDHEMRRGARPDSTDARIERTDKVVRQIASREGWSGILWSDLDESDADEQIAEQIALYTALGREFEWKTYAHDTPADLGRRLRAAGFTPDDAETLLIAETKTQLPGAEPPEGVRIEPVTDMAGVELMVRANERAFGRDASWLRDLLRVRLAQDPDVIVAVVALAGDEPVSSARMELIPGTRFAGLWGGGTVPEWRGRGVYRALIAHRARIAAARGYEFLQVDASEDSRPILEGLGFAKLSTTTPYLYTP
ncbi:GNAT family N-acetyltransferase [Streptomyces roseirectus]|uniref:GNAT family N-acetyltransferase n=1 Tax=Streptomyces roseirectus TaxID=2768066 RepID=A0A7H0I6T8_9ACTN|nr:GNAT family N-acetyltransferase [Streptomyces roseirectus]QNP68504.1 GNAT family N-acetyltransferase [Streptomyces roseirectus]